MKRNTRREHGLEQMNRMEAIIAIEPMSAEQLADAMGCTRSNIVIYLRRLRESTPPRAHIFDYAPPVEHGGRPRPIYAAGDAPDEEFIAKRKPKQECRATRARALILSKLVTPMTSAELSSMIHLSKSRTLKYLKELREGETRQVYICSWSTADARGDIAPLYKLGNLPDKKKPRQTRAERYKKERANGVQHALSLARRRARSRANTAAASPKVKTWFSSLMGA